ncbi:hypothetical protein [Paraburkholderia caribensis]|uniref:hypothetical protein n=1 Tax=Paraburkholderia caribensis TaxID=75105 RepID=UPI000565E0D0|nr:hypothetical protein [Paraburkholderia caribensis]
MKLTRAVAAIAAVVPQCGKADFEATHAWVTLQFAAVRCLVWAVVRLASSLAQRESPAARKARRIGGERAGVLLMCRKWHHV